MALAASSAPSPCVAFRLLGAAREAAVEYHRQQDGGAEHGLKPELVDAEKLNAVLQHGEDHGAERRPDQPCRCRRRC